ncbi:MAG: hypothetical protein QOJ17_6318, partial [Rhodospirillaceae bacterium]|nr:hypothetical protein [Rhodospirillaceae bacterium]
SRTQRRPSCRIGFRAHGINARVGAASLLQLLNSVVDVFLLEIERDRARFLRKRSPRQR